MNRYKILGIAIKNAIKESGKKTDEVAAHLGKAPSLIYYWEDGLRRIQIEELEKLAKFLNKPITFFLEYNEEDLDKEYDILFEFVKKTMTELEELNFPVKLYYNNLGKKTATNVGRLFTRLIINASKEETSNIKFDKRSGGFENEKQLIDYLFKKFKKE